MCFVRGNRVYEAHPSAVTLTVKYHSPTKMWAVRQYDNEDVQLTSIRWYRYKVDAVRYVETVANANTDFEIYNIDGVLRRRGFGGRPAVPPIVAGKRKGALSAPSD